MIGTTLAQYSVEALIGEGGMGEVYRARDTRLGRAVAIKVLPDGLHADPERVARFEREAKMLAALNHPRIAALYGIEEVGGRLLLVMELVEGETLADRLARGALPVDEAVRIALQITEALEAAHEKGIIHRDLKPANIKLTPGDDVKVLDFGLAKAMEPESQAATAGSLTHSPTLSLAGTQVGVILGTAAYMSPEQAKGLAVDHRSDIFSFGVVLYEMLTSRQPFRGETLAETIASVIVRDADVTVLPAAANPRLHELVKRCLEKNPRKRWHAAGDVRVELEAIASAPGMAAALPGTTVNRRSVWRQAVAPVLAAIAAVALTLLSVRGLTPVPAPPQIAKFTFPLAEGQSFTNPGRQLVNISPDGSTIVYVANRSLWVRKVSSLEVRPIPGIDVTPQGVLNPVFSPDGESIVFAGSGTLKIIPVTGGTPRTLCGVEAVFGMTWDESGILFGQGPRIMRVSASGGAPEALVKVRDGELAHGPQMLPGGEWLIFTLGKNTTAELRWETAQVVAYSLKTGGQKVLLTGGASDARYLSSGHLLYNSKGTVYAVRFDAARVEVVGAPIPVVEGVRKDFGPNSSASAHFAVSKTGALVFLPGPGVPDVVTGAAFNIAIADRSGSQQLLNLPPRTYRFPRVSYDRTRIAVGIEEQADTNIAVSNLSGGSLPTKLTFEGKNRFPVWTRDSQRIAFQSNREGDTAIFWQSADTPGTAERLTKPATGKVHVPHSFSPDGKELLFSESSDGYYTLHTVSIADRKEVAFGTMKSRYPLEADISPDGQWVTYQSQSPSADTIFVEPRPPTGAKREIGAGAHPWWSRDMNELWYSPGQVPYFHVVPFKSSRPLPTFSPPIRVPRTDTVGLADGRNYDTLDAKRVLVIKKASPETGAQTAPSIVVVLNWIEELKARFR